MQEVLGVAEQEAVVVGIALMHHAVYAAQQPQLVHVAQNLQ